MTESERNRPDRILRTSALIGGLAFIAAYLFVACSRIGYPFELEWMEGESFDHARRILAGRALYVAPSLSFVPFIYTPLYFYVSAAVAQIVGASLLPLRLVSLASSLGCLALIAAIVRGETRSWRPAILAAGLFAATFRHSGAWFDLARVDSLFLALLLAGVYALRARPTHRSFALAGILFGLSFLTKQAALPVIAVMTIFAIRAGGRHSLSFAACGWGVIAGSTFLLNRMSDGWYVYYVFDLPGQHPILPGKISGFWLGDLAGRLPVAAAVATGWILSRSAASRGRKTFYLLLGAGMVGTSYFGRLHEGGYENVLMPADAFLAVMFGIATSGWLSAGHQASPSESPGTSDRPGRESLVYAAWILQFGLLLYNPRAQIPRSADADAGRSLVRILSEVQGDVLIPSHGYLAVMAGKESHAHLMAIRDVTRGRGGEKKELLIGEILDELGGRRFGAVVLDAASFGEDPSDRKWQDLLERDYEKPRDLFEERDVFWTVTGLRTRPERMFVLAAPRK
jgi:hypothetical protein